jgi:hypothetical protein
MGVSWNVLHAAVKTFDGQSGERVTHSYSLLALLLPLLALMLGQQIHLKQVWCFAIGCRRCILWSA